MRFVPSRRTSLRAILFFVHVAVLFGVWLTVEIGRPRFVGLGFYLLVAVVLMDALLLASKASPDGRATARRTLLDPRVPALVLLVSVAILTLVGTGVVFYLGVTAVFVLVSLRAIGLDSDRSLRGIDLGLLCATGVTVLSSQVFTVAYYVSTADTVNHTSTAIVLRNAGFLGAIENTRYFAFSAFHVLSSVGMSFTGLEPRLLTASFVIVLFQLVLISIYLFFHYLSASRSFAVLATMLVGVNIAYIHYGSVAHYQSMSFAFFSVFLFLLFRGSWSGQDVIVTVPILVAWVLTHHVSVLMALLLTGVPVAYLALRTWRRPERTYRRNTVLLFTTFCLIFGVYWAIVTTKFSEIIVWAFFSSAAAEGLPSVSYIAQSYASLSELAQRSAPFFVDSLHYAFLMAASSVGAWVLVASGRLSDSRWKLLGITAVPATLLYFPNPAWVPLEGLAEFNRWRLMVLPFVVLVPAVGLQYALRTSRTSSLRSAVVVVFCVALVFTAVTSGLTHPGLTDIVGIQKGSQEYLSGEEMDVTKFVFAHMADDQRSYSRSDVYVYLRQYRWALEKPFDEGQFQRMQASHAERRILVKPGLNVVSVEAYRSKGIRVDITDIDSNLYGSNVQVTEPISERSYAWERYDGDVVYSSGEVVVQRGTVTGPSPSGSLSTTATDSADRSRLAPGPSSERRLLAPDELTSKQLRIGAERLGYEGPVPP